MSQCYKSGDFKKYFNENMRELGLPFPSTFFDSYNSAVAHAIVMVEALKTLGKGATVGELIGATTGLEKLKVVAALGAAYYVGAVIGSIAIASGRSLGCGYKISNMFVFLEQNNLKFENWNLFYTMHPEILNKRHKFRKIYYAKAISFSKGATA